MALPFRASNCLSIRVNHVISIPTDFRLTREMAFRDILINERTNQWYQSYLITRLKLDRIKNKLIPPLLNLIQINTPNILLNPLSHLLLLLRLMPKLVLLHIITPRLHRRSDVVNEVSETSTTAEDIRH